MTCWSEGIGVVGNPTVDWIGSDCLQGVMSRDGLISGEEGDDEELSFPSDIYY